MGKPFWTGGGAADCRPSMGAGGSGRAAPEWPTITRVMVAVMVGFGGQSWPRTKFALAA